jgi:hypothetical protein
MKKVFQISIMLIFAFGFLPVSYAQNFTGHMVCCGCSGKGASYSTYLDANSNVQMLRTDCGTCSGTGIGTCEKAKLVPLTPTLPTPSEERPNKVYFDYLLKLVYCNCNRPTPSPDEFWKTRPDLKW